MIRIKRESRVERTGFGVAKAKLIGAIKFCCDSAGA